ncbi:MAG: hypothetical protein QXP70_02030, partial [Methanomassiliicoccales archaeon]
ETGLITSMNGKIAAAAAAVVIVIIIVLAVTFVVLPHRSSKSSVSLQPGTDFVSTSVLNSTVGKGWNEALYYAAGETNAVQFVFTFYKLVLGTNYPISYSSISNITKNYSAYITGTEALAFILYFNENSSAYLGASFVRFPVASQSNIAYVNLTAQIEKNTTVKVSTGTIDGANYTFVSGSVNGTISAEILMAHRGSELFAFGFEGKNAVPSSSLLALLSDQLSGGSSAALSVPSNLPSQSQANNTFGEAFNSTVYAEGSMANLTPIMEMLSGSNLTPYSSGTGNQLYNLIMPNISAAGGVVYASPSAPAIVSSDYVTFRTSTLAGTLYDNLNIYITSNSTYSSLYHSGSIKGYDYFYFQVEESLSPSSYVNVSVAVALVGNSVAFVEGASQAGFSYTTLSSFLGIQIADLS